MKKWWIRMLLPAAISVFLLTGCTVSTAEKNTTTSGAIDTKLRESISQETVPPQDTKNPETAATEPEKTEPADASQPAESQTELESCVHAQWAEEVLTDLSDYEQFILGMEEELPLVYFSTEQTIEDFKILSLFLESIDDDGNARFAVEETYNHGTMTPEEPLLARMELMGTIPNNGISYVDSSGSTRYFSVNVSGYDGSLLLTEFTPQK